MLLLTKDLVRYERAQHIYVNETMPPPPPGTQIFCGNLPRGMGEIELFPYFSLIGEVYEFRLMMEFSGFSRGFCFVTYMTVEAAHRAVRTLHGYVLQDRELSVHKSLNNTKLFLCGVPVFIMPTEIMARLQVQFPGIVNVTCRMEANDPQRHLGWAIVEFDNHRNASLCRKQIWPDKFTAWGRVIKVEWARPIKSSIARKNSTLILENLPLEFNQEDIYKLVTMRLNAPALAQICKRIGQSTAKLEFNTTTKAANALNALLGLEYNNQKIGVRRYTFSQSSTECHARLRETPFCANNINDICTQYKENKIGRNQMLPSMYTSGNATYNYK